MSSSVSPTVTQCLECNAPLSPAETQGLCARCLLRMGLASQLGENSVADAGVRKLVPPPLFPFEFGSYRMLRLLGRGGMGAVYEAEDLASGRRVAVKVLGHSLDSPDTRKRFLREGRLAASINHPNSVYVYGTEEIDGTPVITMELVPGGTLHERVKERGPLPVAEAVDAILQVIPGLEAAHAAGILHRDIKPSNCFLEPGGAVKIGDFGLSISTLSRGDSALTMSGAVLGTPEFASPEQLRGEALDLRSDIYSVGVTLFYLLTGRTPFQAENLVQLLATVLDKPAPSPRTLRAEIPEQLARIVLRCLAKQSGDRFKNYAELRAALLPFASMAPTPATLGLRFIAGAIDNFVFTILGIVVPMAIFGPAMFMDTSVMLSLQWLWMIGAMFAVQIAYFGIGEGRWGATLGKALMGLRVGGLDRNSAGIRRGMLRALIYLTPSTVWVLCTREQMGTPPSAANPWSIVLSVSLSLYPAFLAITARQSNGYATIIDLLTKTRVIQKSAYQARDSMTQAEEPVATNEAMPKIGPYHALVSLGTDGDGELVLGYDTRLLRRVWIRKVPADAPPLPMVLRNAARSGRLRWLQGRRESSGGWDAYEAPPGVALTSLLDAPQPWKSVRHWMLDLAGELAAAADDGSGTTQLSLDRVWITTSGGAKLLDFRAPGAVSSAEPLGGLEISAFLNQVAISALEGRLATAAEARSRGPRVPIALRARSFLREMQGLPDVHAIVSQLRTLVHQVPSVSRLRRSGLIAGCVIPSLFVMGFAFMGITIFNEWKRKDPDVMRLKTALINHEGMAKGRRMSPGLDPVKSVQPLETLIAGRYRHLVNDARVWSSPYAMSMLTPEERERAVDILQRVGEPSEEAMAEAKVALGSVIDAKGELDLAPRYPNEMKVDRTMMFFMGLGGFLWAAVLSLGTAVLCRGGVLIRVLGIAVVTREGADASRGRMLWRACVAWSWLPFCIVVGAGFSRNASAGWSVIAMVLLLVSMVIWSAVTRGRMIQDRVAGTWLVPR